MILSSPEECRDNADECLRWARSAKTEREREAFLAMARTWTLAATMTPGSGASMAEPLPQPKRTPPAAG
jgi:hypothetical protein